MSTLFVLVLRMLFLSLIHILHIFNETFVLLSVGELSKRKNHEIIIKALNNLKDLNIVYLVCGHGELENYLKELVNQLGLEKKVRFLGYQVALPYYHISNVLVLSLIHI